MQTERPLCKCHGAAMMSNGSNWVCRVKESNRNLLRIRVGSAFFGRASTPEEAQQIREHLQRKAMTFRRNQSAERKAFFAPTTEMA